MSLSVTSCEGSRVVLLLMSSMHNSNLPYSAPKSLTWRSAPALSTTMEAHFEVESRYCRRHFDFLVGEPTTVAYLQRWY
jgi:hypothetical protein